MLASRFRLTDPTFCDVVVDDEEDDEDDVVVVVDDDDDVVVVFVVVSGWLSVPAISLDNRVLLPH